MSSKDAWSDSNTLKKHWNLVKRKVEHLSEEDKELEISIKAINNIIFGENDINNDKNTKDVDVNTVLNVSNDDFVSIMNEIDSETKINQDNTNDNTNQYAEILNDYDEQTIQFISTPVSTPHILYIMHAIIHATLTTL